MANNTASALSLGGVPRVTLMPPEVGERRAARARVRMLVRLIVLAVVLVVAAYVGSVYLAGTKQAELQAAQAQTADLLSQQSSFTDAKQANDSIDQITEALKVTTSSEVMWNNLYAVVASSLPDGARVTAGMLTGRAPFDGAFVPVSPISPSKVAVIAVTVTLGSPDDAATFLENVKANSLVSDAALTDLTGVPGAYVANFRVDFNATALPQRFAKKASN